MKSFAFVIAALLSVSAFADDVSVSVDCLARYQDLKATGSTEGTGPDTKAVKGVAAKRFDDGMGPIRLVHAKVFLFESEVKGYDVRVCDDTDAGQANCMNYLFDLSSKGETQLVAIDSDWHTGGNDVTFVCERKR